MEGRYLVPSSRSMIEYLQDKKGTHMKKQNNKKTSTEKKGRMIKIILCILMIIHLDNLEILNKIQEVDGVVKTEHHHHVSSGKKKKRKHK
jgi:hypothetical protein